MKSKKQRINIVSTSSEIEKVALELKRRYGFTIKPNAKQYVAKQVTISVQNNIIPSNEARNAIKALFVSGATGAARYGRRQVQTSDIQKVWKGVRMGPGNCPPNECLFRTVISRKDEFGNDFPMFNNLTIE